MHAAAASMLVVAVVAVAYGTSAPSLGVAEFSPSAQKQLDAPPTTSGDDQGRAGAGSGRRSASTTTTAALDQGTSGTQAASPTTVRPRGRSCVGNPPRQIEDPQSPPCMPAIFEGDNGGATATGVTATEIRIAVPPPNDDVKVQITALFEYFNRHFELYGRRLKPVFVKNTSASTPTGARTFGTEIAAENVFAAITGGVVEDYWGPHPAFFQELARRQVITVGTGNMQLLTDRTLFDELHPYVWSVNQSIEDQLRNVADFTCTALVGRVARHAGAGLADKTRKFAVIAADNFGVPPLQPLTEVLNRCDIDVEVITAVNSQTTDRRSALQSLKDDGVTSIVCLCARDYLTQFVRQARNDLTYQPEWLPIGYGEPEDYFGSYMDAKLDMPHILFAKPAAKVLPPQARPSFMALQEVLAGSVDINSGGLAFIAQFYGGATYNQLLIMASGIQGAGPTLNPDSFSSALMATEFPNTGAGAAPYYQASVGFGPGDHGFYDDYTLAYWSVNAVGYNPYIPASQGSWCYIAAGARFRVGTYPADADARFFSPSETCR